MTKEDKVQHVSMLKNIKGRGRLDDETRKTDDDVLPVKAPNLRAGIRINLADSDTTDSLSSFSDSMLTRRREATNGGPVDISSGHEGGED